MTRLTIAVLGTLLVQAAASAQTQTTPPRKTAEQIRASFEQHKGDFDYLLGDWEFTADNKEWGKAHGVWSAVRLSEGQILDEYRLVGDRGETIYATTTLRAWNSMLDRWDLVGMDDGNGLQDFGTANRVGQEMHLEQRFGVMTATPSLWRIRYYSIEPNRFSWTADRSTDDGKTWTNAFHTIEARRIGPSRALPPLTRTKGPKNNATK